jgi:hypothetical protein
MEQMRMRLENKKMYSAVIVAIFSFLFSLNIAVSYAQLLVALCCEMLLPE